MLGREGIESLDDVLDVLDMATKLEQVTSMCRGSSRRSSVSNHELSGSSKLMANDSATSSNVMGRTENASHVRL